MAIKKTQMYRRNLDGTETRLNPLTEAQYVSMENGQTVQEILSDRDSDKYTPVIENSSSMFRVGEGDNVDLSSSVVEGAYASCVLKGKTMVNLATHSKRQNINVQNLLNSNGKLTWDTTRAWGKIGFTIQGKPNSVYCIKYSNKHETLGFYVRYVDGLSGTTQPITTLTSTCRKFTTDATGVFTLTLEQGNATTGSWIQHFMIFEYQDGMENWDIPCFEGMCDVKSPILSNVGKNLFDVNQTPSYVTKNTTYSIVNNEITINSTGATNYPRIIYTLDKKLLGKTIFVSYDVVKNTSNNWILQFMYTKIDGTTDYKNCRAGIPITLPNEITGDLTIGIYVDNTSATGTAHTLILKNIQIEEGSVATPYESYKSNILSFNQKDDKTIVLRSLPNGVCDTLNIETGEYVQRIGEYRVTGGEEETYGTDRESQYIYIRNTSALMGMKNTSVLICDKFPYHKSYSVYDYPKVSSTSVLIFVLPTSATGLSTKAEREAYIKNLAKTEGITIQYELATPIISTIDVQGFPHAYTNGHVQLSSGSIEQSLTPTVEYSLSANKTGQINSNTKRVSAHQKQLDDFEAMMLTAMVDSAYDKAILQFDYEMQMMSLGGE